jgi:peptide/nickel transport system substrate-binding protein
MDQLSVTFKLKPGITWSDGSPLTAEDSVFSYSLAADPATPTAKGLLDRTVSYTALDAQTVQWVGAPGFIEQNYPTYFFMPLPKHVLGNEDAAAILKDDQATKKPLGWGPYVIDEWVAGDHIRLHKNPAYFRAGEGLPKFDVLVYRFAGNPADSALAALTAGECDVVDQNPGFIPLIGTIGGLSDRGKLKVYITQGPEWEHLDFNIRPSTYDDGYDPSKGDRPDLFGDVRTRRAFAVCINRQEIIKQNFTGIGDVPNGFLAPSNPLFQKDLAAYPFDPDAGKKLLDEVGWKQPGGDTTAVRVASGVKGVPDGTPLSVNYLTTDAPLRQNVAQLIAQNLTDCGIGVKRTLLSPDQLFAPGPEGPLFGRTFDLAEFYWASGPRSACLLYTSPQIPTDANHWIGANVTGYNNPAFDAACTAAAWARPDQSDYAVRNQAAEKLFAEELPVIPLYYQLKVAISRPDLCGLTLDLTARSLIPNLEELDYGKCGGS